MQTKYTVINWNKAVKKSSSEIEFLPLASTPHDEQCTQAGQDEESQILECTALINQIIREAGHLATGAEFFIIANTGHEFGIYYEVGIFYKIIPEPSQHDIDNKTEVWEKWWNADQDQTPSQIYAMAIEQNIPDKWDAEALQELREAGHPLYQPTKIIKLKRA